MALGVVKSVSEEDRIASIRKFVENQLSFIILGDS